jgi:DUF4097 and DUF4098 domain-containing protein YvlB
MLKTSNASLRLRTIRAGGLLLCATSNGKLVAEDLQAEGLEAASSNGSVQLRSICCHGKVQAKTSNARLRAESVRGNSANFGTSNGSLQIEETVVDAALRAETSNASLSFHELKAGKEIVLVSSNGNISGTLAEKEDAFGTVSAHTSNGKCQAPKVSPSGEKKLFVSTSNGNIQVSVPIQG